MFKFTKRQGDRIAARTLTLGILGAVAICTVNLLSTQPLQAATTIDLDLDKSTPLPVPTPKFELKATVINMPNGWPGWVVKIPGGRSIATPAVYKDKVYVGGGYGSHEFYCFSAATGKLIWQYKTDDDGPSAAVVEDDCVAFNTESCTVFVLDAATGKCRWKEWLGDPLMSQPAISNGRLYIAYPGGQRGHAASAGYSHQMLCADLRTGKHLWQRKITADVITAPIIDGENLYFTCMDGTSFSMNASNGKLNWEKTNGGTSAPVVSKGKFVVAEKSMSGRQAYEGLRIMNKTLGHFDQRLVVAAGRAPYLQGATNGTIGPQGANNSEKFKSMDSSVGFGGGAPAGAQLDKAASNMGIASVAGAFGYQGAKAFSRRGQLINAQGAAVNSVDAQTGAKRWQARAKSKIITGETQVFSPPSLGQKNMYLISGDGHLLAVDIDGGQQRFAYNIKQPVSFQPALDRGKIFLGTANGMLVCLNTKDPDVHGWTAWGGNAQHNQRDD